MRQNCRKAKIRLRKRLLTVLLINWGGYSNLYYAFVLTKLSCFLRIFSVWVTFIPTESPTFSNTKLWKLIHIIQIFEGFFCFFICCHVFFTLNAEKRTDVLLLYWHWLKYKQSWGYCLTAMEWFGWTLNEQATLQMFQLFEQAWLATWRSNFMSFGVKFLLSQNKVMTDNLYHSLACTYLFSDALRVHGTTVPTKVNARIKYDTAHFYLVQPCHFPRKGLACSANQHPKSATKKNSTTLCAPRDPGTSGNI